jgi:hypothetical protein
MSRRYKPSFSLWDMEFMRLNQGIKAMPKIKNSESRIQEPE